MNQHDNLRDNIGQIIADYAAEHTDPNGETGIDWCSSRDIDPVADKIVALIDAQRPALTVWYGPMPESNGKSNFTAVLHRKDEKGFDMFTEGITIERGEYPDRVRYEADKVSWMIGQREVKPELWDEGYDFDKHSGYVKPGTPDFDAIKDKRMSEMTDDQRDDAMELWLRNNHGWFGIGGRDAGRHLEFLLKRLDKARGKL